MSGLRNELGPAETGRLLSCASFLPFPLQTMKISPGTMRIASAVQGAVPSTEASGFPRRGKNNAVLG